MLAHNCQVWKWQCFGDAPFFRGQRWQGLARDKIHELAQTANRVRHSFQRLGLCGVRFGHSMYVIASASCEAIFNSRMRLLRSLSLPRNDVTFLLLFQPSLLAFL